MLARVVEYQPKDDQSVQINTEVTNDVLPSRPTPLDFGLAVEAVRQVGNGAGGKIIPIAEAREASHPECCRRTQRRQAASGQTIGHRQNDALP